jgi:hypothetical protein
VLGPKVLARTSVPWGTVLGMSEDDLDGLGAAITEFAISHDLITVPAIPHHDQGAEVSIDPGALDLHQFLELASRIGDGVLYLVAEPFEPDADAELMNDAMTRLMVHKGETGEICVAFARKGHGLLHFWELRTAWYDEWQGLLGTKPRRGLFGDDDEFDQIDEPSQEDRARLAGELANSILADPQFRAARPTDRQRYARMAIPRDGNSMVSWDAVHEACSRAQQMTDDIYEQIKPRLDDLAAELLTTADYQQSSSAPAQKQAAGLFLTARCEGFSPPALYRDELYARAKRLAKLGSGKALF